jgi:hypothetical protein
LINNEKLELSNALVNKLFGNGIKLVDLRYFLSNPAPALITALEQGRDELWDDVMSLWETDVDSAMKALREQRPPTPKSCSRQSVTA